MIHSHKDFFIFELLNQADSQHHMDYKLVTG